MKKINQILKSEEGFTLIELMVVIVIILILASIAIPSFSKLVGQASDAKIKSDGRVIYSTASFHQEIADMNKTTVDWADNTASSAKQQVLEESGLTNLSPSEITITNSAVGIKLIYGDLTFPDCLQ